MSHCNFVNGNKVFGRYNSSCVYYYFCFPFILVLIVLALPACLIQLNPNPTKMVNISQWWNHYHVFCETDQHNILWYYSLKWRTIFCQFWNCMNGQPTYICIFFHNLIRFETWLLDTLLIKLLWPIIRLCVHLPSHSQCMMLIEF